MAKRHKNGLLCLFIIMLLSSCTLDKTDYEEEISIEIPEDTGFQEAVSLNNGNYNISIEALNGTFYKGYNAIRLTLANTQTNENITTSNVTFLPLVLNENNESFPCPHQYELTYNTDGGYYSGYVVFTEASTTNANWELQIAFTDNSQTFVSNTNITVKTQPNKNLNMTAFTGNNGQQYIIALVAPQDPKIAENELVAGIYQYASPTAYTQVSNHVLKLDPRMPEPSMGNHSSPNNKDLTQHDNGLYYGVVNYTMTGNWTLNFILLNENNEVVKGTEVPTDFTPGIQGAKSELFIDILF
ncbi:MAG: hypothetical protein ACK5NB_12080 [Flavobacteriaceae bacterium]